VSRRPAGELVLALALKVLLGRVTGRREPERAVPVRRRRGARAGVPAAPASPPARRSRPLIAFMLANLAVGMVLMLVFHAGITRVVGVLTLFAFIVSGVFLIADPNFLGEEESTARERG
jgi:hypothetical protein